MSRLVIRTSGLKARRRVKDDADILEMRLLVYGSRGWIGGQFCRLLDESGIDYVGGLARADSDDVINEIETYKPTHVLSLIGRTHGPSSSTIDYLEEKGAIEVNLRDNLYAPVKLAALCSSKNIHFL